MSTKNKIITYIALFVLCLVLALFTATSYRTFGFEFVEIKGISMEPTIAASGKKGKVQKNSYNLKHDDIVVAFHTDDDLDESEYPSSQSPAAYKNSFNAFINNLANIFGIGISETVGYECVIKRVIGLPGDTIQIKNAKIYRNGQLLEESFIKEPMIPWNGTIGMIGGYWKLGDDDYFLLGDNRNYSYDSDNYGIIKTNQIYGKVVSISNL